MTGTPSLDEIKARWPEVVRVLAGRDEHASRLAAACVPTTLDRRFLHLTTRYPVHAKMLERRIDVLREAVVDTFGDVWVLRIDSDEEAGADPDSDRGEIHFLWTVKFSEEENDRLEVEAVRRGLNPIELIRRLVLDNLPAD